MDFLSYSDFQCDFQYYYRIHSNKRPGRLTKTISAHKGGRLFITVFLQESTPKKPINKRPDPPG